MSCVEEPRDGSEEGTKMKRQIALLVAVVSIAFGAGSTVPAHALMCTRSLDQVCAAVFTPLCTVRPNACPK